MDEKEMYLKTRESEFQTTLKVLKAYPGAGTLKPSEVMKSAKDLAFSFPAEQGLLDLLLSDKPLTGSMPQAPETMKEVIAAFEHQHTSLTKKIKAMSEAELNKTAKFFVGPKKMADVRKLDICWMMLRDETHHRGQFSVYVRIAGGVVPSIYGPTAEDPWM